MNRQTLIDELKKWRSEGLEIGIRLTASTEELRERYIKLSQRKLPTQVSRIPEELWSMILGKLTVDTLFRLYQKSSLVRRLIEKQAFWKGLIERDYGVIPKFPINLKLYYLRIDKLRIAGVVWDSTFDTERDRSGALNGFYQIREKITYIAEDEIFVTRSEKIIYRGMEISLPRGERAKESIFIRGQRPMILTYSGKLYTLNGKETSIEGFDFGPINQIDPATNLISTKDGKLYQPTSTGGGNTMRWDRVPLETKILTIDERYILDEDGKYRMMFSNAMPAVSPSLIHWISDAVIITANERTNSTKRWITQPKFPILATYSVGLIDSHLQIWALEPQSLGSVFYMSGSVINEFENVLQVVSINKDRQYIRQL